MITITGYSKKNPHGIKWSHMVFSGGELQVKLDTSIKYPRFNTIIVEVQLEDSEDIMLLLMLNSSIINYFGTDVYRELKIGYIPYGRQDRVCAKGEAFSLNVMTRLINGMVFDSVSTLDAHSDVSRGIMDLAVTTQDTMLFQATDLMTDIIAGRVHMVAPDKGATPKVSQIAATYGLYFIQGNKIRDPETGHLSGFSYDGNVEGKNLLIVDDICDGGGTFIGLTEELLAGGAKSVALYVSHGIFSKGLHPLYHGGISHIYTTDTIYHGYRNNERFTNLYWS